MNRTKCSTSDALPRQFALALILLLSSAGCFAQFGLGVTGSLEYLDNPLRLTDSDDTDLDRAVAIDASYATETERVVASLNYSAIKHDYENNLLDDREIVDGRGLLTLNIVPDVLLWNLTNFRSNQLIDASQPDILDNRQVINSTSTGPALSLPFGGANFINLQLNHTITAFEETGSVDQNQTAINADYTRILSARLRASLRTSYTELDFNSSFVPNFEISSVSVLGAFSTANYDLSLELGEYETERVGLGGSSNPLIQLDALYRLNTRAELRATYSKSVENTMSDIRNSQSAEDIQADDDGGFDQRFGSSNLASVFEQESKGISFSYTSASLYTLQLEFASEERITQGLLSDTNTDDSISLNVQVPMGPRLNLGFRARISELDFQQRNSLQEREEVGFSASYRLNRRLSFSFLVSSMNQESNLSVDTNEGLNALLSVTYRR